MLCWMSWATERDNDRCRPEMNVQPVAAIRSYHAHIYFEGAEQRRTAEILRQAIAQRFTLRIGRWHDRPVGPHTRPMYQLAFVPAELPRLVPWLMINRSGLAVLIHPNTGRPRADHLTHALWLGEILAIDATPLPEDEGDADALEMTPNTNPTIEP
jgi:aromatic ring-cleaving dioxygenase